MKHIIILLLFFNISNAQEKISLALYQDAKLMITGDGKSYDSGTLDVVLRLEMAGKQQKYGYMIVFPEFEYSEIKGKYYRYSANVGYIFNKLILNNFEAGVSGGWGSIDRYGKNFFSFGFSGEISYKITDNLKVSIMAQGTERKDLGWLWGETKLRLSGFIGVKANL